MADKEEKGMVVFLRKEVRLKLKRRLLELEDIGVIKTKAQYCSELIELGLNNKF